MQTVLDRMTDIRTDNQHSLQEILDLGVRSKQIGKVMEIINAVADRTKLIAFNAALEASSAGEAEQALFGRGQRNPPPDHCAYSPARSKPRSARFRIRSTGWSSSKKAAP